MTRLTWEALVDDFQVDGKPTRAGRLDDIKRGLRQLDIAGAPAGAEPVSLTDDVGPAADVTAAVLGRNDTPARPHAAVERTTDDDHLVQRARRAERIPSAVLP